MRYVIGYTTVLRTASAVMPTMVLTMAVSGTIQVHGATIRISLKKAPAKMPTQMPGDQSTGSYLSLLPCYRGGTPLFYSQTATKPTDDKIYRVQAQIIF
jgi:hypothetical protein